MTHAPQRSTARRTTSRRRASHRYTTPHRSPQRNVSTCASSHSPNEEPAALGARLAALTTERLTPHLRLGQCCHRVVPAFGTDQDHGAARDAPAPLAINLGRAARYHCRDDRHDLGRINSKPFALEGEGCQASMHRSLNCKGQGVISDRKGSVERKLNRRSGLQAAQSPLRIGSNTHLEGARIGSNDVDVTHE